MTNILTSFFELTLGMSAVIALLALLLLPFGKKLRAKSRYLIWTLVIIRLAFPVGVQIMAPLFTLPEVPNLEVTIPMSQSAPTDENTDADENIPQNNVGNITHKDPDVDGAVPQNPVVPDGGNDSVNTKPQGGAVNDNAPSVEVEKPSPTLPHNEPATTEGIKVDIRLVLTGVWLAGAVIYAAVNLISYVRYTKSILRTSWPAEEETEAIYDGLCRRMKIRRKPLLRVSSTTDSPAAFGYFRRYIVLPEIPLSLNSLELTLTHELTHLRRGDLTVKLFSLAARSFHWFNPLVHYAAYKCETECELSCDEIVLADRDDVVRTEYSETLVNILKFCRRRKGSLTTHFSPKKNAVKMRLGNILYGTGKRRGILLVTLSLVLCIVAGTVIGCSFASGDPAPDTDAETTETESVTTEPEPTETETETTEPEPTPEPTEYYIDGLYYLTTETYTQEYREENPGNTPFVIFLDDGICLFMIFADGTKYGVEGTYTVGDGLVSMTLNLDSSPLRKETSPMEIEWEKPDIDPSYTFEIIDSDKIIIGSAEDSAHGGDCGEVKAGDAFVRDVDDSDTLNDLAGLYSWTTEEYSAERRINYLILNNDETCALMVSYFHGKVAIDGKYTVDGSKIRVDLLMDGSYMDGESSSGTPYMDDSFVFEIVDEHNIKIGPADESAKNISCYGVKSGDIFTKATSLADFYESHLGYWYSYPDMDSYEIIIHSADHLQVKFSFKQYKGVVIDAIAVKKGDLYVFGEDISPEWSYQNYAPSIESQDGHIRFSDDGVILQYGDNPIKATVKSEDYDSKRSAVLSPIESKCGKNGWLSVGALWYGDQTNLFENAEKYQHISGESVPVCAKIFKSGEISLVVRVYYDLDTDNWLLADVFYVHTNGKVLQGEELKSFMEEHGKTDMIFSADDADLAAYFAEATDDSPYAKYIGHWHMYSAMDVYELIIYSANDEQIEFSFRENKGINIKATAIKQDGKYLYGEHLSPEWSYWHYITDREAEDGYILLNDNSITVGLSTSNDNQVNFDVKSVDYENKRSAVLRTIHASCEENGWIVSGTLFLGDASVMFENAEAYQHESGEEVPIASDHFTSGDISIAIRIYYDRETDNWLLADVFYAHTNGKVLQGEELKSFMEEHGKTDMIFSADDADLAAYLSFFDDEWVADNAVVPDVIPEFDETEVKMLSLDEFFTHGIYFKSNPKYRSRYYQIPPGEFQSLVSKDDVTEFKSVFVYPVWDSGEQPDEMYLVSFIKYFKIPREDAEKALDEYIARLEQSVKDGYIKDISTEQYEKPNLDIIYTFDNEIINNYYGRPGYSSDDTDIIVEPMVVKDNKYYGVWYFDTEKKVYIRVSEITVSSITFGAVVSDKISYFTTTATRQDDKYVFEENDIKGTVKLEGNCINLSYTPADSTDEVKLSFTIKNEVDKIDWPTDTLSDTVESRLQGVIDELTEKKWTDVEVIPHEPDSNIRWKYIATPYELPENGVLYCITARSPFHKAIVYINVYSVFVDGEFVEEKVSYASMFGRSMEGTYLESFMKTHNLDDEIISADLKNLGWYFVY